MLLSGSRFCRRREARGTSDHTRRRVWSLRLFHGTLGPRMDLRVPRTCLITGLGHSVASNPPTL